MPTYSVAATGRSEPFLVESGGIVSLSATSGVTFEYTKDGPVAVSNGVATWNSVAAPSLPIMFQESVFARVKTSGTACVATVDNSPSSVTRSLYVPDYLGATGADSGSGGVSATFADATSGAVSIELGSAAALPDEEVVIKKIDSSDNTVTVLPYGSETIDGESSLIISRQWTAVTLRSDGSNWALI